MHVTGREYDLLRKDNLIGFASYYLQKCYDESEWVNNADVETYKTLIEIDSKLGTKHTDQLIECLYESIRIDLVKVGPIFILTLFNVI